MALTLNDPEADALAHQLARLTGESLEEAVRRSLAERLRNEKIRRGLKPFDRQRVEALIERFKALPVLDERTEDEILGYDQHGLPS